ncbi:TetR/AcrR family transcriptional regulator [Catenulispora subtropica]
METRRYRGLDASERQVDRRERLVHAAFDLYGTLGYQAVSIRRLCRHAGLTERHFYESFTHRHELLSAVYETVFTTVRDATFHAVADAPATLEAQARAGLRTFIHALADDPRVARVLLFETVGVSESLDRRRRAVVNELADFIAATVLPHSGEPVTPRLSMVAAMIVGGINELMAQWTQGQRHGSIEDLIDTGVDVSTALYRAFVDRP